MICVYDKRDDFSFLIVKFSFLDGDVLFTPSLYAVDFYIVDISQLDRKRKKNLLHYSKDVYIHVLGYSYLT